MTQVVFTITDVGLAAEAAVPIGEDLLLSYVRLGSGQYAPDGSETDLMTPFNPEIRFDNLAGSVEGAITNFSFSDIGDDSYNIGEIGIFTEADELYAIISDDTDFVSVKIANTAKLWNWRLTRSNMNAQNIAFSTPALVPLATEILAGISRRNTTAEAESGLIDEGHMTPLKVKQAIVELVPEQNVPRMSETQVGTGRIATNAESTDSGNNTELLTPAKAFRFVAVHSPYPPTGSTTRFGLVRRATLADHRSGSRYK